MRGRRARSLLAGRAPSALAVGAVLAVALAGCGTSGASSPGSSHPLSAPSGSVGQGGQGGQASAAAAALGDAAASVAATSRTPDARPAVVRGPSTRIAPRLIAQEVRPGQAVRVATVRISGGTARVEVVPATGPREAERRIAAAQADPAVMAVQIDHRVHLSRALSGSTATGTATPSGSPSASIATDPPPLSTAVATQTSPSSGGTTAAAQLSDDPLRADQWALDTLGAERLWTVSRGAGQIVAVIDSGVDGTHPGLTGQVLGGIDYVVSGGNGWSDRYGHGTHVAGIVAAVAGNRIGVAGLAPGARILPVRVLDGDGEGWDSDIAAGTIWAADHGAGVVNLSLGGADASDAVRAAVSYAISRGAVVVAAVGNERGHGDPVNYPAGFALPGEVGVAATTRTRVSATYSNTGSYVTLAAPGDTILSTLLGSYAELSGTSMATPYASAAVALLRAAAPSLGPVDVVRDLTSTAQDLETTGRDDATGAGLIDPAAALCAVGHCPSTASPSPSPSPTTPSPTTPSPSPTPLKITVRAATARVVAGHVAVLDLTVSDASGPVTGAVARLTGPGPAATARTDAAGRVVLRATSTPSGAWTATVAADGHQAVSTRWALTVVPAVAVRWQAGRVTVTVTPARGQMVTVRRGSSVIARRRLASAASGRVTLRAPASGAASVTVEARNGLAGVVATRAR